MLNGIIFLLIISGILTWVKVTFGSNKIAKIIVKVFIVLTGLIGGIIIQICGV